MNKKKFTFKKIKNFESARFGKISTAKGNIDTPAFMPVGTIANVKAMFPENISQTKNRFRKKYFGNLNPISKFRCGSSSIFRSIA